MSAEKTREENATVAEAGAEVTETHCDGKVCKHPSWRIAKGFVALASLAALVIVSGIAVSPSFAARVGEAIPDQWISQADVAPHDRGCACDHEATDLATDNGDTLVVDL